MDSVGQSYSQVSCDLPKRKCHPGPIVSLGRIIGYKLAGIGVTMRRMEVFNTSHFRHLLNKQEVCPKTNDVKLRRTVSFSNIVQEAILEDMAGDKRDTNVNAIQRRASSTSVSGYHNGSETNSSCVRKVGNKRQASHRQHSPIVSKYRRKTGKKGKAINEQRPQGKHRRGHAPGPKARRGKSPRTPRQEDSTSSNPRVKNGIDTPSNVQAIRKTRSSSALVGESSHPMMNFEATSKNINEKFIVVTSAKDYKKRPRHRRSGNIAIEKSSPVEAIQCQPVKLTVYSTLTRKGNNEDIVLRKRNTRITDTSCNMSACSGNEYPTMASRKGTKSKPRHPADAHKSPSNIHRKSQGKTRWADVVAGTSKSVSNVIQPQNGFTSDNSSTQEAEASHRDSSITHRNVSPQMDDSVASSVTEVRRRSGRLKAVREKTVVENLEEQRNGSKSQAVYRNSPLNLERINYQNNFPSLEEQKGKNPKREKWQYQQVSKNSNRPTRSLRKANAALPTIRKPKRFVKNRSNKREKIQRNCAAQTDRSDSQSQTATDSKSNCAPKDSFYVLDIMQVAAVQNVGKLHPIHEEIIDEHNSRPENGEMPHFTNVPVSSDGETDSQTTKTDICSKLGAMSVDGMFETSSSPNPEFHKRVVDGLSEEAGPSMVDSVRDANKTNIEEPGPSEKKVATRYRALLRRDFGKTGVKSATEMMNSGRWTNMEREKNCGRFYQYQQRRNQIKMNDISCQENSHPAHPINAWYYCIPQDNNGCPMM